jgi:hypothetical protein
VPLGTVAQWYPFHPRPSSRRFARPRLRAVRYLRIKVDEAIEIAEKIDI